MCVRAWRFGTERRWRMGLVWAGGAFYSRPAQGLTCPPHVPAVRTCQDIFELGRRYKILNPDKMRSEYGKLMYMLMDSSEPAIQELLEFRCVRTLRTVYVFLEERGGLAMLDDALMHTATAEIISGEPREGGLAWW